mmetsp:Transcript_4760/g.13215  ORF Transcript_4760/g.13215 Transcript_4760/m.13215 type:complete len:997 (-) Transcript_4760:125-3115(-)|eukprot:CAMPEP_0117677072 /NCGR_PEP_ID=MMETSP0804-20121206/16547_1 /TAXON_ID=1074897 /ORGANISM="Tetraselmis astigmatica, Strain CCMP880" /LENGTH=996 /DNA_ID=CAMNT_0005486325 /DNA_START=182 /DNA_END=3172 /DNA_ORIENTATION=+
MAMPACLIRPSGATSRVKDLTHSTSYRPVHLRGAGTSFHIPVAAAGCSGGRPPWPLSAAGSISRRRGGAAKGLILATGFSGLGCAAPLAARAKLAGPVASTEGGGGSGGAAGGSSGGSSGGGGNSMPGNGSAGNGRSGPSATQKSQDGTNGMREDVILLDISGMKCGGCVGRVKRLLEEVPEVSSASVNLATETALVRVVLPETGSPSSLSECLDELRQMLCDILGKVGFKTTVRQSGADSGNASADRVLIQKRAERMERLREATIRLAVAGALASTCLLHHLCHWLPSVPAWLHLLGSTPVQAAISAAALLGPGRHILVDGFRGIVQGAPDMNSLVGLGAVAAFGMSAVATALPRLGWPTFFEEPAMLIGVVLLGKTLEERAKLAASSDMASLQRLLPSMANLLLENGATRQVPSDVLQTSDLVVLKPGERAPVDGVVVNGCSTVDEAALTGEPLPVTKQKGSEVMAGTVNVDGTLVVQATACGSDTAIADVVRLVEEAQSRTAPVQRLADKVSGTFAYGVMGASLATFAFWATIGTQVFPQVLSAKLIPAAAGMAAAPQLGTKLLLSLQLACNVLVVACPCALGLATPTAVLVGTSAAAKQGLLIRGGDVLETASKLDTVVFDKTGTLTAGRPAVVDIETSGSFSRESLMSHVAAVERNTPHPLAKAIVGRADSEGSPLLSIRDGSFRQEPGSGACATVGNSMVLVGNREWLETHGVALPASQAATVQSAGSSTHVHVAVGGKYAGKVTLQDEIRPGAAHVVATLKKMGVQPVMLSGDAEEAARAVGASLGFSQDAIFGGVKPAGKDTIVAQLQEQGRRVAMVGDGVNDTAALARADVGIAMGGGVDAASEVADIVLLGDRISQVMDALQISKATFNKIQQNLCWAFGYNLIGIPVAAGALLPSLGFALTPSLSGAVMAFSSVAVMTNSLLLQLEVKQQVSRSLQEARRQAREIEQDGDKDDIGNAEQPSKEPVSSPSGARSQDGQENVDIIVR